MKYVYFFIGFIVVSLFSFYFLGIKDALASPTVSLVASGWATGQTVSVTCPYNYVVYLGGSASLEKGVSVVLPHTADNTITLYNNSLETGYVTGQDIKVVAYYADTEGWTGNYTFNSAGGGGSFYLYCVGDIDVSDYEVISNMNSVAYNNPSFTTQAVSTDKGYLLSYAHNQASNPCTNDVHLSETAFGETLNESTCSPYPYNSGIVEGARFLLDGTELGTGNILRSCTGSLCGYQSWSSVDIAFGLGVPNALPEGYGGGDYYLNLFNFPRDVNSFTSKIQTNYTYGLNVGYVTPDLDEYIQLSRINGTYTERPVGPYGVDDITEIYKDTYQNFIDDNPTFNNNHRIKFNLDSTTEQLDCYVIRQCNASSCGLATLQNEYTFCIQWDDEATFSDEGYENELPDSFSTRIYNMLKGKVPFGYIYAMYDAVNEADVDNTSLTDVNFTTDFSGQTITMPIISFSQITSLITIVHTLCVMIYWVTFGLYVFFRWKDITI